MNPIPGPVVIGGVGGSGTRLIAEMLAALNTYIGADLNEASDNQWFTLLFRRPRWYNRVMTGDPVQISRALALFEAAMTGARALLPEESGFVVGAALDTLAMQPAKPVWALRRMVSLLRVRPRDLNGFARWGWKEPNTYLYLPQLAAFFPRLKFIQVIRHGLDMAYSDNQNQLHNWGRLFGIEPPRTPADVPHASVRFWSAANQSAVEQGERLLGGHFLLLNFDALCVNPQAELPKLLAFLEAEPERDLLERLLHMPRVPASMGRYRQHASAFGADEIAAVRGFGFDV